MYDLSASGNQRKGPAAELFRQIERGSVLLFVGNEILSEIRDVLRARKS
ncbi:MAG: hypothetical protein H0V31_08275 [Acidobacteria bacterium]|nr:hypothetical protein [Acidobacteriota bacterium]